MSTTPEEPRSVNVDAVLASLRDRIGADAVQLALQAARITELETEATQLRSDLIDARAGAAETSRA